MMELLQMSSLLFVEPSLASGLVFRTTNEADMFRSIHEPTDSQEILDAWPRVDGTTYFADPTTATGEAADWTYDAVQDTFVQPNNSATPQTILSSVKLNSYTFETILTSPATDDDLIGVAIAAEEINGNINMLFAWVVPRGINGNTFVVAFLDPSSTSITGDVIDGNAILQTYTNPDFTGWDGKEVMIKATRSGGEVAVQCSDWDGTSYLASTEIIVNLNDLVRDGSQMATIPTRYGFATHSQANSTYLNYIIRSGEIENDTRVYSENDNLRWVYQDGVWTQTGTAYDDFSEVDRVSNRLTKELFDVNTSTLQFRSNDGISYGVHDVSLPASTTTSVDFATIMADFTYSESFIITGIFQETDLTATLGTDVIGVTTTTVNGSFFVLLSTPEVVDPETNVTEQTIGFRRVDVTVT